METKSRNIEIFSLIMGLVFAATFIVMWQGNKDLAASLVDKTKRPAITDILSAAFWLGGMTICIYRIITKPQGNKFLLYFWAIFCFLCAGEEVKWCYQIFHYSIPSIQNVNYQHDISIHNLNATTKWPINPQRLFYFGFFIYFLIIPLLMFSKKLKFIKDKFHYVIPNFYFLLAIWLNIGLSILIRYVFMKGEPITVLNLMGGVMSEIRELLCRILLSLFLSETRSPK
jgi:hypothetical protein